MKKDEIVDLFLFIKQIQERLDARRIIVVENTDTINSFAFMFGGSLFEFGDELMNMLAGKKFCVGCLYRNCDVMRKGITRYMTLETNIENVFQDILISLSERMTKTCIQLKAEYPAEIGLKECKRIKNPAHNEILDNYVDSYMEIGDDDDDDDDDF